MTVAPNGAAIVYELEVGITIKLLQPPATHPEPSSSNEDTQKIVTSLSVVYANNPSIHDASDVLALMHSTLSQGMCRVRSQNIVLTRYDSVRTQSNQRSLVADVAPVLLADK
jgi:hypothetical protein